MNLDQVARTARVSTATVSRVLNNAALVKSTTRARVMRAIEELKYSPNLHARSLAGGKSRSLGVIVPNIENPFFLDIFKAIEAGVQGAGYELIMADADRSLERLRSGVRLMIGRRVAGLAAIVSEMDSNLVEELAGNRIPLVFLDAGTPRRNVTNIRVNYRGGMDALLSYLYSLGHRRVGFLAHHNTFGPVNERMKVALEAAAGYSGLHVSTAVDKDSLEGGRLGTRALLVADPTLTSMVCLNDLMAVGAMRELRESGIRVPQDVSISGFDNIEWAKFCHPALTSVHIPRDKIGQIICDCLIKNEKPSLVQEFLIDPALIVRDSTGPVSAY